MARTSKKEYANMIKIMLGARDNQLTSLEKMTLKDLEDLSKILIAMSDKYMLA